MSRVPPHKQIQGESAPEGPLTVEDRISLIERRLDQALQILDQEIDFGYPDVGDGTAESLNVRGQWVSVSLTNANQLGNGAGAPVTFTHNMNLATPVAVATGSLPNVRPLAWMFTHGDKTGANAAPAAAANQAHTSFYFRMGDAVTADAIDLRIHSAHVPSATAPLLVEIFFHPAVQ